MGEFSVRKTTLPIYCCHMGRVMSYRQGGPRPAHFGFATPVHRTPKDENPENAILGMISSFSRHGMPPHPTQDAPGKDWSKKSLSKHHCPKNIHHCRIPIFITVQKIIMYDSRGQNPSPPPKTVRRASWRRNILSLRQRNLPNNFSTIVA